MDVLVTPQMIEEWGNVWKDGECVVRLHKSVLFVVLQ
jgi:hypothetical protein